MKIVSLLFLALMGCSTATTQYDIKNDIPFNQIEFGKSIAVGIAIYNNSIEGLNKVIEADSLKFAGKQIEFNDLSADMSLAANNTGILNPGELSQKYREIKYVIAVVEHQPKISKNYYTQEVGSYSLQTSAKRVSVFYETTMAIPSEIMLLRLPDGQLIAKAKKTFSETKTASGGMYTPEILAELEVPSSNGNYPQVQSVSAANAANYFYDFLKDINPH